MTRPDNIDRNRGPPQCCRGGGCRGGGRRPARKLVEQKFVSAQLSPCMNITSLYQACSEEVEGVSTGTPPRNLPTAYKVNLQSNHKVAIHKVTAKLPRPPPAIASQQP